MEASDSCKIQVIDHKEMENQLLANIKAKLPELETLLEEISSHWVYEDSIYRF